MKKTLRLASTFAFVFVAYITSTLGAQNNGIALTIRQAVDSATKNFPSIAVSQEQVNAAAASIALARTAYLPRIDGIAQLNRATRNNLFGLLLPQSVLPSISGPVLGTNNFGTVWGSAVGATVTWEPFDFGFRAAGISEAKATRLHSEATLKRTQFEVSLSTADAFITLTAAEETLRAAQASVQRAEVLQRTIQASVNAQLRPGADGSRADAELAAARTQLAQAQQAENIAKALLAQFVGIAPEQVAVSTGHLLQLPAKEPSQFDAAQNPLAAEQGTFVEKQKAELHVLEKAYAPRVLAQGSAYARGTGASVTGARLGGFNGLVPDTQNYALGLSVTFSVLDFASIRARKEAQSATVRAEAARSREIAVELTAQWETARAALAGARSVAANTPTEVSSADAALQQATARYQSGLGNIAEVADAQRLLTQAQIDDALARLNVWRALLRVAGASGDIDSFLTEASQ